MGAAASLDAPNVAQVDFQQGSDCPTGGQSAEIPLMLSLETFGNTVMVMFILNFQGNATGALDMRPVIDGHPFIEDQLSRAVGDFSG